MKKCKLPNNWIIVSSKSHPDRIYYFNIKTNQSTWTQPTMEEANDKSPEHIRKQRKHYHEEEETSTARTLEYDLVENKKFRQQQSLSNKETSKMMMKTVKEKQNNETSKNLAQERMQKLKKHLNHDIQKEDNCSIIVKKHSEKFQKNLSASRSEKNLTTQIKALRGKLVQSRYQKPAVRNKSLSRNREYSLVLPFLQRSSEHTENKTTVPSSKKSSLEQTENNDRTLSSRSMSLVSSGYNKATTSLGENTTFTPQIQKDSGVVDKKAKENSKNKQELKITKQTLVKTSGKQEKNTPNRRSIDWNKNDIKPKQRNLAQDRMQRLRNEQLRNLNHELQKCEENDYSILTETSLERLNETLLVSNCNRNIGSISIHKNADIRLKRLHSRILKETIYESNAMLNNNNRLQIQRNNKSGGSNMTKDKLVEEINQEILYEEMDWEPMKDEEVTLEVEVVRAQLNNENCANVSNCRSENTTVLTQPLKSQEKGPLYIVIDTNVFLTNLEIIEQARDASFKNYPRPFIVIPWTVICELDYLKSDKSRSETLRTNARKAISFINEHFASKHPRVVGQTREQAATNKEDFCLDCPDDEILQCCLQIKNLKKDVILLSYDKNLCTKAMIHSITAVGRDDPLEKLDNLNTNDKITNHLSNDIQHSILSEELRFSDEIFEDTKLIMKDLFSTVIVKQMTEIYGPDWELYVIIKPPWTVVTALKCIVKHWIAAMNESFQQHTESTARKLLETFERLPVGGRKLRDVQYTLEKCSDLIQTINRDKHYDLVVQSFNAITEIKTKCLKCIVNIERKQLHDKIGIIENSQQQERSAEKALQCFKHIYSYARDFGGLAANIAGKVFPLNYNTINPSLSHATVKRLQPDITKKVSALSYNLNKLLVQAQNNSVKYQALSTLQHDINAFLACTEITTMDVDLLDIFYCVTLKEEVLKIGLRQLQELGTHYRALYLNTCI